MHADRSALGRCLDGIKQQIGEYLLQIAQIAVDQGKIFGYRVSRCKPLIIN